MDLALMHRMSLTTMTSKPSKSKASLPSALICQRIWSVHLSHIPVTRLGQLGGVKGDNSGWFLEVGMGNVLSREAYLVVKVNDILMIRRRGLVMLHEGV